MTLTQSTWSLGGGGLGVEKGEEKKRVNNSFSRSEQKIITKH